MNRQSEDFLLAKNFEHIFEVMIDTLIGGSDKQYLPKELTEQKDGKLVDHMFIGQGLIEQSDMQSELTYISETANITSVPKMTGPSLATSPFTSNIHTPKMSSNGI